MEATDLQDVPGAALAKALGVSASCLHLDVRRESDWISAIDSILQAHSKLEILVNNAGITGFESPAPQDPENESCVRHCRFRSRMSATSLNS